MLSYPNSNMDPTTILGSSKISQVQNAETVLGSRRQPSEFLKRKNDQLQLTRITKNGQGSGLIVSRIDGGKW